MTSLRIAFTELQRILHGRMARAAVIALCLVPTLYGGLYLFANHDPYAGLTRVPAAIVVLDTGAADPDGQQVHAGRDVADQLVEDHRFDWHVVAAEEARDGVEVGRYDFALTIPKDFSAALVSSARFDPRQARLTMETNDANSYISTTIADKVTDGVRDALAKRVGTQAAENFLLGLAQIRGSLSEAADGAGKIAAGLDKASAGATKLSDGAGQLATGAGQLEDGLAEMQRKTAALPAQTRQLADGAAQVADGNRQIAAKGDQIAGVSTKVRTRYDGVRSDLKAQMESMGLTAEQQSQLLGVYDGLGTPVTDADSYIQKTARDLDRLAAGSREVADGADQLADGMPALTSGIRQAHDGSAQLSAGATKLSSGATELRTGLGKLHAGAHQLEKGLRDGVDQIPALDDETRTRIAQTIGDPVDVRDRAQTAAGSYGAGLAPFFMALAAWVGGYVLFLLVRPLSNRAMAANQTPLRVALGGWYTPALIGLVQMIALFTVVVVAIDIVPAHLPLTLLFLVLCSVTFIAILHMLNAWLGSSGQFLGLVMMVLQLITAGGTFPWQTIPTPLHWLHHVLPMSYAVDGLRQLMYGGLTGLALRDAAVLAAWLIGAVVLTSIAARKQRMWSVKRIHPELAL